jgi:hypothetical protein
MKPKKTKADRIREYLIKNPNADVTKLAERFQTAKPVIYKLRKDLQVKLPVELPQEAPVEMTWTATANDQGEIVALLTERGHEYGPFRDGAALMQGMKRLMADHARAHDKTFSDDQWEALEMIVHKMGRIVNGNPDKVDHWKDIAGYAMLVADRLEGTAR